MIFELCYTVSPKEQETGEQLLEKYKPKNLVLTYDYWATLKSNLSLSLFLVLCGVQLYYFIIKRGDITSPYLEPAILFLLLIATLIIVKITFSNNRNKNIKNEVKMKLELFQDHLNIIKDTNKKIRIEWHDIITFEDKNNYFLLYAKDSLYIPETAFVNIRDRKDFKTLFYKITKHQEYVLLE